MSARGPRLLGPRRPPPTGTRAVVLGIVLSLLIPGLGHVYMGLFVRALIWFAGALALALVIGGGEENTPLALAMGGAIAACAAVDTLVVRRSG